MVFTARCYAERGYEITCRLSVRPSVTFRNRDQIGWNSAKIISRPNTIAKACALADAQHGRSGATGTPPKLGLNRGEVRST